MRLIEKQIVFIGGLLSPNDDNLYIKKSNNTTTFASERYFRPLIEQLQINNKVYVVSSPFMGKYPIDTNETDNSCFTNNLNYYYCHNSNKTIKRLITLKHSLYCSAKKVIIENNISEPIVFVTMPNYFYLSVSLKIVKKFGGKVVLFIPDLPQFSNFTNRSKLILLLKKIESRIVTNLYKKVNLFVLFSKNMVEFLPKNSKYIIQETIIREGMYYKYDKKRDDYFCYIGTINHSFGLYEFAKRYSLRKDIQTPLILAGGGDAVRDIISLNSPKIKYVGILNEHELEPLIRKSIAVINPRIPKEYTKYSFPSKTIEYLKFNGNVVMFPLNGISEEYNKFLTYPKTNTFDSMIDKLIEIKNSRIDFDFLENSINSFFDSKKPTEFIKKLGDNL